MFMPHKTTFGERFAWILAHGICHHVNETVWHGEWTHADIWHSSLELAIPHETLFFVGLERASEAFQFAPEWLIQDYWDALTGQLLARNILQFSALATGL
jgi:hypothetical protein